jgi:hypothetical protein
VKTRQELIQRLRNDPEFRKQFQSCAHSEELLEFVKSQGYDFSREPGPGNREPTPEDLPSGTWRRTAVGLWLEARPEPGPLSSSPDRTAPPRERKPADPGTDHD